MREISERRVEAGQLSRGSRRVGPTCSTTAGPPDPPAQAQPDPAALPRSATIRSAYPDRA
jgi:hypothetical protein